MSGQTTTNATEVAVPEKKAITVSQVQQDLKDGLDRKAIGAKYSLMLQHRKLKNKKVIKPKELSFDLVDDVESASADAHEGGPLAETVVEPISESTPENNEPQVSATNGAFN
mgnify:CR=1 FL=1